MRIKWLTDNIPFLIGILVLMLFMPYFIPLGTNSLVSLAYIVGLFIAILGLSFLFTILKNPEGETQSEITRKFLQTFLTTIVYFLAISAITYFFDAILFRTNRSAHVPFTTALVVGSLVMATGISYLCLLRVTYLHWLLLPPQVIPLLLDLGDRYPWYVKAGLIYNGILVVIFLLITLRLLDIDLGLFYWFFMLLAFGVGNLIIFILAVLKSEKNRNNTSKKIVSGCFSFTVPTNHASLIPGFAIVV
jgi:hypothetical protein